MANKYGVIRTDNMYGTDVRAALVSVRYFKTVDNTEQEAEIENGSVVLLGGLLDDEREIRKGSDVTAAANLDNVVILAAPEVPYDERLKNLDEYINEAGKNIRGYRFHSGQTFSLTKEALVGKAQPAVNDIVELAAGHKLNVAASATTGSTQVGKIIAVETAGRYTYYVIEVA